MSEAIQEGYVGPDGQPRAKGLIPRNRATHPCGCLAFAPEFPDELLIPESDWPDWIRQAEKDQSTLFDIRNHGGNGKPIPSIDQDGFGYCWAHSSVQAMVGTRAIAGEPYVPLSAFMVAATIKDGRDEGGNGIESLQFIAQKGVCTQALWPQKDADVRAHTNDAMWADASKRKFTGWYDTSDDPHKRRQQVGSGICRKMFEIWDNDGWGHSICGIGFKIESGGNLIPICWNSWSDSWGDNGTGPMDGSVWPDEAWIAYDATASYS